MNIYHVFCKRIKLLNVFMYLESQISFGCILGKDLQRIFERNIKKSQKRKKMVISDPWHTNDSHFQELRSV